MEQPPPRCPWAVLTGKTDVAQPDSGPSRDSHKSLSHRAGVEDRPPPSGAETLPTRCPEQEIWQWGCLSYRLGAWPLGSSVGSLAWKGSSRSIKKTDSRTAEGPGVTHPTCRSQLRVVPGEPRLWRGRGPRSGALHRSAFNSDAGSTFQNRPSF